MADLLMKQAIAVIDDRTTVVCLHVAGQIRAVDAPFETLLGEQDNPPFHVHCRTMDLPWMPGFVNSLRKDANAELMRRPLKQRRIGPGGEIGGSLPPRVPPSPTPTGAAREWKTWTEAEYDSKHRAWYDTFRGDLKAETAWSGYGAAGTGMNAALRFGGEIKKGTAALINEFETFYAEHAVELADDLVVRRGVYTLPGFDPEKTFTDLFEAGEEFVEAGWMSTTTSESLMKESFSQAWQYEVLVPSGTRVVYGVPGQWEIVLPRNRSYKVLGVDKDARRIILELQ